MSVREGEREGEGERRENGGIVKYMNSYIPAHTSIQRMHLVV